ncbi:MAG: hypothetical protein GYA42_01815 [Syntrophomonadaceae bacterium]|nr:hypothetical protein [Syntrophomonadaceae bacterium]
MLTTTYKKKGISITHVWFMEETDKLPAIKTDIFYIHDSPIDRIETGPAVILPHRTLISDLNRSEEALSRSISRKCRQMVKQAEQDGITAIVYSSRELRNKENLLKEFGSSHDKVYEQKGIQAIFNHDLVKKYIEADMLIVSVASFGGKNIAFHSYIISDQFARGLYSVSNYRENGPDRHIVVKANTYLHYKDLLHFRKKGLSVYDWGGVQSFDEPSGIDRFKMKFGGQRRTNYNIIAGQSVVGKATVTALKMWYRLCTFYRKIISGFSTQTQIV